MGAILLSVDAVSDTNGETTEEERQERHNVYNEIIKKRPAFTKVDKEKLYEESVHLNRRLNDLRGEQQRLIVELQRVEEEKLNYQRLISDVETYVDTKKGQKINLKESWLVINLKKQLQQLQKEIVEKQQTIIDLKRSPFTTQKEEHDIALKIFQEYADKYRMQTKELEKSHMKKKVSVTSNDSAGSASISAQQKVMDLQSELQVLECQNEELEGKQKITERKVAHTLVQLNQVKEELREKESELDFLRDKIIKVIERERKNKEIDSKVNSFKQTRTKTKEDDEIRLKKNSENERMRDPQYQLLREKEQFIIDNQKKIGVQKQLLQEITNYEISSKNELNDELAHLKQVFSALEAKYEELKIDTQDMNLKQQDDDEYPLVGFQFTVRNNILEKQQGKAQIKVPKVTSNDIKIIAYEIKLRLLLKAIPLADAVKKLFCSDSSLGATVTIDYMLQRLQMSPFAIKSYDQALLFARFLIEDNQEDFLILDLNRSNNYRVIRSVFKNAIGNIKITDEQQEKALWKQISTKIRTFEQGIRQQFDLYDKNDYLSSELLLRCLEETLNEITSEESDYILMRIFEATNDYIHLKKELIFQIFSTSEWISRDHRRQIYQVYLEDGKLIDDQLERFPTEQNSPSSQNMGDNDFTPGNQGTPHPSQFKKAL